VKLSYKYSRGIYNLQIEGWRHLQVTNHERKTMVYHFHPASITFARVVDMLADAIQYFNYYSLRHKAEYLQKGLSSPDIQEHLPFIVGHFVSEIVCGGEKG
jgi:hypothetical protein